MKPGPYEPRLSQEQPFWYLPGTGTDVAGRGFGPAWSTDAGATPSHPTPSSGFTTQFRRTRFTSTAVANIHLGIFFANADHVAFWRGNATSRGGFFFVARFMVNAIPDTAIRFFAGLSAQTGTGLATSNTVPANSVGLWCDSTDAGSLKIVTCNNAGTATKNALTSAETLTAARLYEFSMICNPNQSEIVTQLVNLGDDSGGPIGTIISSQNVATTMPSTTVFMAPQVGLGNAAHAAGGDTSLDIVSVYAIPNQRLHPMGTP